MRATTAGSAPDQQQRYTHALAETMFGEPATGGTPDEQPGAMPEIFPSPDQGANIDRCWTCRSMFMQAWGNYGTAWAVVHQWLGVRPDLGDGARRRSSRRCRRARPRCRAGTSGWATDPPTCWPPTPATRYSTEIDDDRRRRPPGDDRAHPAAQGAQPAAVVLDGQVVHNYQVVETNRGTEVTIPTTAGHHTLTITV